MTALGINVIAMFLGALLLAPRRGGHRQFWRCAREQARSELKPTTTNRLRPERRSGQAAGAFSQPVERAATAASPKHAKEAAERGSFGRSSTLARELCVDRDAPGRAIPWRTV
jgi:hypothetical protein